MIGRLIASYRAAAAAPVHPLTAILGVVCVVVGTGVIQRYVRQEQAALAQAYGQFRTNAAAAAELRDQMLGDRYPSDEDLDPLGAGEDGSMYDEEDLAEIARQAQVQP
jgi:xanthosine utilization system XapX-like protein